MKNIRDRVKLEFNNGIAEVLLSRAEKHNALDMEMFYAIRDVIKIISKNKDTRVVIVSGDGPSFCSGLDIKSVMKSQKDALKLLWKWLPGNANLAQQVTVGWRRLDAPVIMVLHGKCWGGGMQIALGADFRIAAKDCSLAIMESRWGLIPDMGGTIALQESMPLDKAMLLAMTAEPLEADDALKCHLISQVAEDPMEAAQELAKKLIERSPDTNKRIKKIYHKIWNFSERRVLAKETINQWKILLGKNQKIAVKRELGDKSISYR